MSADADRGAPAMATDQAVMGRLPLLDSSRVYRSWASWTIAAFIYGAAAWSLLSGGAIGAILPPVQGIVAFVLGQTIALLLCSLVTGVVCGRYGIDTVDAARPAFGVRGAQVVTVLIFFVMMLSILAAVSLMGLSVESFTVLTLGINSSSTAIGVVCVVLIALAIVFASLGPNFFAKIWNWFVVPLFVVFTCVMIVGLVVHFGIDGLFDLRPPVYEGSLSGRDAFVVGIEIGAGMGFAYWTSMGALYRLVRSPRVAIHGSMIGWAFLTLPVIAVGIFSSLGFGSTDPTVWMHELMGSVGGTLAVIFILIATFSCIVTMFYIVGVAVRQTNAMAKLPSWTIMAPLGIPALLAAFWPEKVLDAFPAILGYIGVGTVPIVAVMTVDFFVLRRGEFDLRHVFTYKPNTKYWFWKGLNPVAFVSLVVGIITYLSMYDPYTYEYNEVFRWATASLPSFVATCVTYGVLTRLLAVRYGLGDYPFARGRSRAVSVEPSDITL